MIKDYCPGYFEVVAGGVVQVRHMNRLDWGRSMCLDRPPIGGRDSIPAAA